MKHTSPFLKVSLALLFCLSMFGTFGPAATAAGANRCKDRCNRAYHRRKDECRHLRRFEKRQCEDRAKNERDECRRNCR
jgi:hypothetical protein